VDILLAIIREFGISVGGPVVSTIVLAWVVRVLWREQQQVDHERVADLRQQFQERLADKNAELAQVWSELRSERDEKRREQAAKEGFERLLQRQMDLTKAAQEDGAAWRTLAQGGARRP
jgi:hypothetical protein